MARRKNKKTLFLLLMVSFDRDLLFFFVRHSIKTILASIAAGVFALLLYLILADPISVWICIAIGIGIPGLLTLALYIRFYKASVKVMGDEDLITRQPIAGFLEMGFHEFNFSVLAGKVDDFYTHLWVNQLRDENELDVFVTLHTEPATVNRDRFEVAGIEFYIKEEDDHLSVTGLVQDIEKVYTTKQLHFLITRVTETLREMKMEPAILEGDPADWEKA